jgi:hypothetical protein
VHGSWFIFAALHPALKIQVVFELECRYQNRSQKYQEINNTQKNCETATYYPNIKNKQTRMTTRLRFVSEENAWKYRHNNNQNAMHISALNKIRQSLKFHPLKKNIG